MFLLILAKSYNNTEVFCKHFTKLCCLHIESISGFLYLELSSPPPRPSVPCRCLPSSQCCLWRPTARSRVSWLWQEYRGINWTGCSRLRGDRSDPFEFCTVTSDLVSAGTSAIFTVSCYGFVFLSRSEDSTQTDLPWWTLCWTLELVISRLFASFLRTMLWHSQFWTRQAHACCWMNTVAQIPHIAVFVCEWR